MESFGRGGVEGSTTIDQLAAKRRGGEGWRVDGEERGGEGTPSSNRLSDAEKQQTTKQQQQQNWRVMIREVFVLNRDMKNHDFMMKNLTRIVLFLFVRNGPY